MENRIFRKVSLERLSSPEQLDQLITVTSPKGWIALAALILLITTAVVWGVLGSVPTKVQGQGILLKSGGVRNIVHTSSGQITDISVVNDEYIHAGQVVARIDQSQIVDQIMEYKKQLEKLMPYAADPTVQGKIKDTSSVISQLQAELESTSKIVSPYSGRVLEVKLNKGEILTAGMPLLSMELVGEGIKELESVIYVPAEDGKKITPGMEAQISPASVKKEEYGCMLARVVSVSEFPATYSGMLRILGSDELVQRFMGQSSPVEVHVDLITSPTTKSGYKWSSKSGPPMTIDSGTLCNGSISIEKESPIKLVLPIK